MTLILGSSEKKTSILKYSYVIPVTAGPSLKISLRSSIRLRSIISISSKTRTITSIDSAERSVINAIEQIKSHDEYVLEQEALKKERESKATEHAARHLKVHQSSGYKYKPTPEIVLKGDWLNAWGANPAQKWTWSVRVTESLQAAFVPARNAEIFTSVLHGTIEVNAQMYGGAVPELRTGQVHVMRERSKRVTCSRRRCKL